MFDSLPETRQDGAPIGKSAVSTSLIAHCGLLILILAVSLLTRVRAGEPPPIPIDWVLVTPQSAPKLGDSLDAGGPLKRATATRRADNPSEKRPMEQPNRTPEPEAPPPASTPPDPAGTPISFDVASEPLTSAPTGGDGEHGRGPGSGPGDGPGNYGVPWGDPDGHGTGGPSTAPGFEEILNLTVDVEQPRLVQRVEPEYPRMAISARVQGTVILEGVIGTTGRVESLRVLKSIPLLDDAALRAVGQWRYVPARLDGKPVRVYLSIRVEFRIE